MHIIFPLMNSVTGGAAHLSVQVVTLNEHCVVAEAADPHVSLALTLQLDAYTDVEPAREEETEEGKE